jgi:hypothetical protein
MHSIDYMKVSATIVVRYPDTICCCWVPAFAGCIISLLLYHPHEGTRDATHDARNLIERYFSITGFKTTARTAGHLWL